MGPGEVLGEVPGVAAACVAGAEDADPRDVGRGGDGLEADGVGDDVVGAARVVHAVELHGQRAVADAEAAEAAPVDGIDVLEVASRESEGVGFLVDGDGAAELGGAVPDRVGGGLGAVGVGAPGGVDLVRAVCEARERPRRFHVGAAGVRRGVVDAPEEALAVAAGEVGGVAGRVVVHDVRAGRGWPDGHGVGDQVVVGPRPVVGRRDGQGAA